MNERWSWREADIVLLVLVVAADRLLEVFEAYVMNYSFANRLYAERMDAPLPALLNKTSFAVAEAAGDKFAAIFAIYCVI